MKFSLALIISAFAIVNASVIPLNVIEGPSSKTTIVGPDGSVISSVQPGGRTIVNGHAAVLEHFAPLAAYSVPTGPITAHGHIVTPVVKTATVDNVALVKTDAAIVAPATKTVISETAHTVVSHDAPVVAQSVELTPIVHAEKHVAIHAAPAVAAVGTKTSVSEHSTSIVHPSPVVAVRADPVVAIHEAPVAVAHATPVAVAHAVPVGVARTLPVAPVVGTKTTISEHGQTIVSHSAPSIHTVRTGPVVAPLPSVALAHATPVVATHAVPHISHVAPVAAVRANTLVSEHHHVHSLPLAQVW